MADRLRIVEFDVGGRPYGLLDLEQIDLGVAGRIYKERDSFKPTPGEPNRTDSTGSGRFDGSRTVAERIGNGQIAARWAVKGATANECLDNAAVLLEHVRTASSRGRYIEWRPDGASRSTFYELRGTGNWTPDYRRMVFVEGRLSVEISWPVAPLPELDRMDICDPFDIPGDAELLYTNLLSNPGAEVNATDGGWAGSGGTLGRVTSNFDTGIAAFSLTTTAAAPASIRNSAGRFPAQPGVAYSAAAMFKAAATPRSCRLYLDFYDAANTRINLQSGSDINSTTTGFTRATVQNKIAPAGTAAIQVIAEFGAGALGTPAIGEVHYIDSLICVQADAVPAYFDGDSDKARWTGTPHNSTSELYDRSALDDYTFDTGGGTLSAGSGQLVPTSTATKRFYHSARGYKYEDLQATHKFTTGAAVTAFPEVNTKRLGASDRLRVSTSSTFLLIEKVVAGANTNLASVAHAAALTANTTYWLTSRINGNVVTAELWQAAPSPMGTPYTTLAFTLTGNDAAMFGAGVAGDVGLSMTPPALDWRYDDFKVEPLTYKARTLPEVLTLPGLPGDEQAPGKLDLHVTPSGGSAAPLWAMFGWWPKPAPWNRVWNGDFETDTAGWQTTGHNGLNGGATAVRISGGGSPGAYLQVTTDATATAFQGVGFAIYGRFRKGITYTVSAMVWVNAGTWALESVSTGTAGDDVSSANLTLTGWRLVTYTWTPTADRDGMWLNLRRPAGSSLAQSALLDAVQVYEGTTPPTLATQTEGRGSRPPIGEIPAESASGATVAADANYRGGNGVKFAASGAGTGTLQFRIDPATLTPDAFTDDELDVELWGRLDLDAGLVSPKITPSTFAIGGTGLPSRYTGEYGKTGKLLTKPSSGSGIRLYRLGTLTFYLDRLRPAPWMLQLDLAWAGGSTGNFGVDVLYALPIDRRAVSGPTGRAYVAGEYPTFSLTTAEMERIIRADGSGLAAYPGRNPVPAPGMSRGLELDPGENEALVVLSSLVPDDPTATTGGEQKDYTATVHLEVVPRVHLARGS